MILKKIWLHSVQTYSDKIPDLLGQMSGLVGQVLIAIE